LPVAAATKLTCAYSRNGLNQARLLPVNSWR
jgi:hypothetical protein